MVCNDDEYNIATNSSQDAQTRARSGPLEAGVEMRPIYDLAHVKPCQATYWGHLEGLESYLVNQDFRQRNGYIQILRIFLHYLNTENSSVNQHDRFRGGSFGFQESSIA